MCSACSDFCEVWAANLVTVDENDSQLLRQMIDNYKLKVMLTPLLSFVVEFRVSFCLFLAPQLVVHFELKKEFLNFNETGQL